MNDAQNITLARKLGKAPHKSYLKRRLQALGLQRVEEYIALAVRRGCHHYDNGRSVKEIPETELNNEELCAALLSAANEYQPRAIRVAAQLLSDETIDLRYLARLVVLENSIETLEAIQKAGQETEPDNPFWDSLKQAIPTESRPHTVPKGVLPHPSRFRIETGYQRGSDTKTVQKLWLRPIRERS